MAPVRPSPRNPITPGTPHQSSLAVIRPMSVQAWANGRPWGVVSPRTDAARGGERRGRGRMRQGRTRGTLVSRGLLHERRRAERSRQRDDGRDVDQPRARVSAAPASTRAATCAASAVSARRPRRWRCGRRTGRHEGRLTPMSGQADQTWRIDARSAGVRQPRGLGGLIGERRRSGRRDGPGPSTRLAGLVRRRESALAEVALEGAGDAAAGGEPGQAALDLSTRRAWPCRPHRAAPPLDRMAPARRRA